MEEWVTGWEQAMKVGPRLSEFMGSSRGIGLIKTFKANGLDLEVIPFLLTHYVWPMQALKAAPSRKHVLEFAKQVRKTARGLSELERQNCGVTGTLRLKEELTQLADRLTDTVVPVGQVGHNIALGSRREVKTKRDLAKRTVVFFLLGYLREVCLMKNRIWPIVTQFLIAADLAKADTKSRNVASWWSVSMKRVVDQNGSVQEHQKGQLLLFCHIKESVHAVMSAS